MTTDPSNIDAADIDADSTPPPADWSPDVIDADPDPSDVTDRDEDASA